MIEGKLSFLLCLLGNKKSLFRSENSKYGLSYVPCRTTKNNYSKSLSCPILDYTSFKFTYGVSNKMDLKYV